MSSIRTAAYLNMSKMFKPPCSANVRHEAKPAITLTFCAKDLSVWSYMYILNCSSDAKIFPGTHRVQMPLLSDSCICG